MVYDQAGAIALLLQYMMYDQAGAIALLMQYMTRGRAFGLMGQLLALIRLN